MATATTIQFGDGLRVTDQGSGVIRVDSSGPQGPAGAAGAQGPPGATGATGPQGPAGTPALPTPIVNGQWVYGSGGAAIWKAIAQTDLPGNISGLPPQPPGNDYNQITQTGWYNSYNAANSPPGYGSSNTWLFILHFTYSGSTAYSTQTAWTMQDAPTKIWTRSQQNGTWNAWVQIAPPVTYASDGGWVALPLQSGWTNYPGTWQNAGRQQVGRQIVVGGLIYLPGNPSPGNGTIIGYVEPPINSVTQVFPILCLGGVARVDISGNGTMTWQGNYVGSSDASNWVSLSGITYTRT